MKILLTGSGGFIGKNLKEGLCGKYDLVCSSSAQLDLRDTEAVERYVKQERFDVIIHGANVNSTRNQRTTAYESLDGNLRMFFNLERCKEYFGSMFYFGSGAEYDMEHYVPGMKEEFFDTYVPKDAYGFSKYVMSKACGQSQNIYDLRLFGVYGKYEEWERRFLSNAICRALKGKPITIEKNVYFDYLWIDDLVMIMEWFLKHKPQHKHYNVCRGSKIDLYSLACMVREVLNIDCEIMVKETGWKREYSGNNERLLKEMGGFEFAAFRDTIYDLGEYYRKHLTLIDENLL